MRKIVWCLVTACLLTACSDRPVTQPSAPADVYRIQRPALQYEPADLAAAAEVEYITMRGSTTGRVALAKPLWGDLNPTEVAHVLGVLRRATPVEKRLADEPLGAHCWLVVHYRAGDETCVAFAYRKTGQNSWSTTDPVHYMITDRGEVASAELDQFLRGGVWRAFMPPVSPVVVEPREAFVGDTITVRGQGFVGGGSTAVLELLEGDGKALWLGEVPVNRGEFTWTGRLPERVTIPPWLHVGIRVKVGDVGGNGELMLRYRQ